MAKNYGWSSVAVKKKANGELFKTVLGDTTSRIFLYRDGSADEVSVHCDEKTRVFTAVFYGRDGTRLIATGSSEEQACNKVRPPRV